MCWAAGGLETVKTNAEKAQYRISKAARGSGGREVGRMRVGPKSRDEVGGRRREEDAGGRTVKK